MAPTRLLVDGLHTASRRNTRVWICGPARDPDDFTGNVDRRRSCRASARWTATAATPCQARPPPLTALPEFHTDVDRTPSSLRSDDHPKRRRALSIGAALMFPRPTPGGTPSSFVATCCGHLSVWPVLTSAYLLIQRTPAQAQPPQLKNNRIRQTEEQPNTYPTTMTTTGVPTRRPGRLASAGRHLGHVTKPSNSFIRHRS